MIPPDRQFSPRKGNMQSLHLGLGMGKSWKAEKPNQYCSSPPFLRDEARGDSPFAHCNKALRPS